MTVVATNIASADELDGMSVEWRSPIHAKDFVGSESPRIKMTVHGVAQLPDGTPAEDAVIVSAAGDQAVSDTDGSFVLTVDVPLDADSLSVTAVATINGVKYTTNRHVNILPRETRHDIGAMPLASGDECESAWVPTFGGRPGVNSHIFALTAFDDGLGAGTALYAGGNFATSPAGDSYVTKWQGCPIEPECAPSDLNCDGVVDGAELLILLSAWGECSDPNDCPADLNDDGVVDGADLLILLSNWG